MRIFKRGLGGVLLGFVFLAIFISEPVLKIYIAGVLFLGIAIIVAAFWPSGQKIRWSTQGAKAINWSCFGLWICLSARILIPEGPPDLWIRACAVSILTVGLIVIDDRLRQKAEAPAAEPRRERVPNTMNLARERGADTDQFL